MRSAEEGPGDNAGRPLDYYNLALDKSYADRDRPHFFKMYANYELPIGRDLPGAAKALLSGWAVSAILNYGSGTPMMFTGSRPNSLWNGVASRANVSPGELRAAGFKREEFDLANPNSPMNTYLIRDQFSDPQTQHPRHGFPFCGPGAFPRHYERGHRADQEHLHR